MRVQVESFNPCKERPSQGGGGGGAAAAATSHGLAQLLQAMEELDSPESAPAGLEPSVWERFCLTRRAKVESEQQVALHSRSKPLITSRSKWSMDCIYIALYSCLTFTHSYTDGGANHAR